MRRDQSQGTDRKFHQSLISCYRCVVTFLLYHQKYSLVAAVSVLAPAVYAGIGVVVALVHVDVAVGSLEARLAGAPVVVAEGGAGCSVPAGLGGAVVLLSAVLAGPAQRTGAGEGAEGGEVTGAAVAAGGRVTDVLHRGLTQGVGEAQGAGAGEGGHLALVLVHHAAPSVLADLLPGAAWVEVLAVFSHILWGTSRRRNSS